MSLGKGLNALITSTKTRASVKKGQLNNSTNNNQRIWYIPHGSISPDPNQPRKYFDDLELQNLADSIKEHGILQPILVSEKADGNYEIISGERRWRASKLAGLTEVPTIVKKLANQQKLEVALIENIQRENLNPIEEAFAYKRLIDEFDLSHEDVAKKVGKARSTVSNFLRLLTLPEEIKNSLIKNELTIGKAKAILSLESKEEQLEMFASLMGQKITKTDLERAVSKKTTNKKGVRSRDPNIVYLEDQLRNSLGTKVTITSREKGKKGRITIDYYSPEELSDVVEKLMK